MVEDRDLSLEVVKTSSALNEASRIYERLLRTEDEPSLARAAAHLVELQTAYDAVNEAYQESLSPALS